MAEWAMQWQEIAIMANQYHKGQLVRISGSFTLNGADQDPTTITFKVKTPAGVMSSYTHAAGEITKDATGKYHKDISGNEDMEITQPLEPDGKVMVKVYGCKYV
jgi:hypothetical protein